MGISAEKRKLLRRLQPQDVRSANATERRTKVAQLLRDGHHKAKISKLLHVSKATVTKDVQKIQREAAGVVNLETDGQGGEVHILNAVASLQEIMTQAKNGIATAESPAHQNAFLKTFLDAVHADLDLKMKVGMIRTEPKRIKSEVQVVDGLDVTKASTEELMAMYRRKAAELPPAVRNLLGGGPLEVVGLT